MLIDIPETRYAKTVLPGGWRTESPDVTFDPANERYVRLVRTFMRLGASPKKADDVTKEELTRLWNAVWAERIRKSVGRWAHRYARANHMSLDGFDPERVALEYVPGQAYVIRTGDPEMKRLFAEMRRRA